jgi:hypothetical protein
MLPGKDFDWAVFSPGPVYAGNRSELKGEGWSAELKSGRWSPRLAFESSLESRLLREHLPSDRLWGLINTFKDALGEALGARLALARGLTESLSREAGLPAAGGGSGPGLFRDGLARLDGQLAGQALHDTQPRPGLREEGGEVWAGDALLLRGGPEQAEARVLGVLAQLRGSEPWRRLLSAAARLSGALAALSEERDVIKLGGYLPGACRSCARFTT